MGELWGLSPLFPGETDLDQLRRIFTAVGTPDAWLAVRRAPDTALRLYKPDGEYGMASRNRHTRDRCVLVGIWH